MERNRFDLNHFSAQAGMIGRLQTLSRIYVVAGDSISIDLEGIMRLSPLRRNLTMDCMVDLMVFYVPHRHIYEDDWIDFMKDGPEETVTFANGPTPTATPGYLGLPTNALVGSPLPKWFGGYNQIWNRYFRVPTDDASIRSIDALETSTNGRLYGVRCARPKKIWTTGLYSSALPPTAAREVASTSTLDILALAEVQARYKADVDRAWFAQRYNDVMEKAYGSGVNIDADQRPELCMRRTEWLSGYDVDGTGSASLGQYSGKAASVVKLDMPRKFFPEHGMLWVMALLRFPAVHEEEVHYLDQIPNPTYTQISGDPDIWSMQEPIEMFASDLFSDSPSNTIGYMPYGQWYRTQPNFVNPVYDSLNGFAFIDDNVTSQEFANYCQDIDYDETFQTSQLGQWQSQLNIKVDALRVVPPATRSIYAGAR